MNKPKLLNLLLLLITTGLMLVAAEYIFRRMIFSKNKAFTNLQDAGKYATQYTDDYWKLVYRFGSPHPPPKIAHPLLGWKGYFNPENYVHQDFEASGNRRKVLLFGDSFAMCVERAECFQDIMNRDTSFTKDHFLLNYGVGGYGVDQIHMLCSLTVGMFENPFVVISILPNDMDRSVLTVRTGQKPYYVLENGQLVLKGVPIKSDPVDYYRENPPSIRSYMLARALHSDINPWFDEHKMPVSLRERSLRLNEKIILTTDSILRSRNLQYVFLIFDNLWNADGNWRYDHLMSFMHLMKLPYFGTGDLVKMDTTFGKYEFDNYILHGDGHPNTHYNTLVSNQIKKFVFNYDKEVKRWYDQYEALRDTNSAEYIIYKMLQDPDWMEVIRKKAAEKNIPTDSMVRLDAEWLMDQRKNHH